MYVSVPTCVCCGPACVAGWIRGVVNVLLGNLNFFPLLFGVYYDQASKVDAVDSSDQDQLLLIDTKISASSVSRLQISTKLIQINKNISVSADLNPDFQNNHM